MGAAVLKSTLQLESEAITRQRVWKGLMSQLNAKFSSVLAKIKVFISYQVWFQICLIQWECKTPSKSVKRAHKTIEFWIQQCVG